MGIITQINYVDKSGYKSVHLSGYFMENELNRRIVYRNGTSNITNAPAWINQKGKAEDVAFSFFNAFKDVVFSDGTSSYSCLLGISSGISLSRGKTADHERCGEYLGNKIYHILKASEMSYRVEYDFENNIKMFNVWSGKDRTHGQIENNPVTFSTRYGNIKEPNILIDNTNYKNGCLVDNESNDSICNRVLLRRASGEDDYSDSFHYVKSTLLREDYSTESEFFTAMQSEGNVELNDRVKVINVEFDAMEGSYEYRKDFDLGDKCNLEIPEVQISADAVLIGCYEVIKKGEWSLSLEFGTPILRR